MEDDRASIGLESLRAHYRPEAFHHGTVIFTDPVIEPMVDVAMCN